MTRARVIELMVGDRLARESSAAAGEEKSPEVIKKGKEDADAAKAEAKK